MSTVALSESEVYTGGFNAEYGNAQSGIVEIRTREGGDRFAGEVRWETDNFGAPDRTFTNFDRLSIGLGGPLIVDGLTYFLSYEGTFEAHGPRPDQHRRAPGEPDPHYRQAGLPGAGGPRQVHLRGG